MMRGSVVFIVDDDIGILRAMERLIASADHPVQTYQSAEQFLLQVDPETPGCAILDFAMPGLSGLDLQTALGQSNVQRPLIFLTAFGDVATSVQAMKGGAFDFLSKPVDDCLLLNTVAAAIETDARQRAKLLERRELLARYDRLTPRQKEIFPQIATGRLNKQIGADLGIAEKTVKVHRRELMERMEARTLADLVRMADHLSLDLPP